ncbi:hypothetical protein J6590_001890 [Homalodisca vitripennis]|nr:hypothetical protein J6590_001890 [Homalodisca vitripennis]
MIRKTILNHSLHHILFLWLLSAAAGATCNGSASARGRQGLSLRCDMWSSLAIPSLLLPDRWDIKTSDDIKLDIKDDHHRSRGRETRRDGWKPTLPGNPSPLPLWMSLTRTVENNYTENGTDSIHPYEAYLQFLQYYSSNRSVLLRAGKQIAGARGVNSPCSAEYVLRTQLSGC